MSRMDSFMNLSPLNTTISGKVIWFSDISAVNFIVGWNVKAHSSRELFKIPQELSPDNSFVSHGLWDKFETP